MWTPSKAYGVHRELYGAAERRGDKPAMRRHIEAMQRALTTIGSNHPCNLAYVAPVAAMWERIVKEMEQE